ncbi:hypothetical protein HZB02_03220 [Candidatus Woesearchaeota archaeon]|nr:hypothetical protein [Candidatus Woesearchaeota archaeon]
MAAKKKRLTVDQEFQIMKLVLDKFLWVGILIMLYGLYMMVNAGQDAVVRGLSYMLAGAAVLVLFMFIIIKEYEIISK